MKLKPFICRDGYTIFWTVIIGFIILVGAGVGIFYLKEKGILPLVSPTISPSGSAVPSPQAAVILAKQLIKPEDIVLEKADVTPQIQKYDLPLKTKDISNFQKFSEKIQLSFQALSLLQKNGFAVVSTPESIGSKPDEFAAFYASLKHKDIPIFITTDKDFFHTVPLTFAHHHGALVITLRRPNRAALLCRLADALTVLGQRSLLNTVWLITDTRIYSRQKT